MRMLRGLEEVRLLPSRHHFALFRLVALIRLSMRLRRGVGPVRRERILVVDRDQSAFEMNSVSVWITLILSAYCGEALSWWLSDVLAWLLALPLAVALIEVPVFFSAALMSCWNLLRLPRIRRQVVFNSAAFMALVGGASVYFLRSDSAVRFVALQFFALASLNAIAAILLLPLRGMIARLEARLVEQTCAL